MPMLIRTAFAAALVCAATLAPAGAQYSSRDAACRYKVAQATRNYTTMLVERGLLCHKQRAGGTLPSGTDCNDPATWGANGFGRGVYLLGKDRALHRDRIEGCNPDAPSLAALGYASCPAPCDGIALGSFTALSDCTLCLADACMLDAMETVFGTTPLPAEPRTAKCVERAGRHLESYYNARTYMQQKCQLKKDKGYAGWTAVPDCGDLDDPAHPFYAKNLAFRSRRDAVLTARCDGVDVAGATGTCGSDPASLAACASAAAEQCSNLLFPQVFP